MLYLYVCIKCIFMVATVREKSGKNERVRENL